MKKPILLKSTVLERPPVLLRLVFSLLLVGLISSFAMAQSVVKGRISDESGTGMPGVNVIIKGTTVGATTDAEGQYTIDVPAGSENATLVVSFIGYVTEEQSIAGRTTVDVNLTPSIETLNEIVVVGYGEQKKESVTGSVVSLSGDKMREVPSPNITTALQGRLAGVDMTQSSSQPGATMQIRVRGTRSLNASNDPLVVLDGIPFPGSLSDINPNDIKSVDILKDAASTAIYGSRGANGVILITTNKGKKGQKAQFSYNGYYGIREVFSKYPMMNGAKLQQLRADAGVYTNGNDEFDGTNTDWQDLLYGTGSVSSHDIGVLGGTEGGSYNGGIGYYKDKAVLPGQDFTRLSLNASLDQKIGNYLRLGFGTNTNYSITNGSNLSIYDNISASPLVDPYNADGTFKRTFKSSSLDETWTRTRSTINALGDGWIDQTKALGSYNSIFAEVKVPGVEGLTYRINGGLNYRQTSGGQYTGQGAFAVIATTVSSASITNTLLTSWTAEHILTYDRVLAEKHSINLMGLYSAQNDSYNKSSASVKDIPSDAFQFYNLGRGLEQPVINPGNDAQGNPNQDYYQAGLKSAMIRLQYAFDERFLLQATYRQDGASRLASGHKWVSYPGVSVGWNIHREGFMQNVGLVNNLKLRAGYGTTSTQSILPYSSLGQLTTVPYNFGATFATGASVTSLPNPELGWEFSTTLNAALEFGLFKNRLTGTVEYYKTTTSDLLFTINLPQTSGVNSYVANVGESENKGVELTLNGVILDKPEGLSWDLGFNIYANRNELTKLASGQPRDEANWWFVGHPIDVIYDYEAIGIWQAEDANLNLYEGAAGNVGMIKVKYTGDFNPDGTPTRLIGAADRQIMSMQPKFQGGFNTRLAYKGLDLSVVGLFKSGGLLIATPYGQNGYLNSLSGRKGNIDVDYWTPTNTDAKYPKPNGVGQSADAPRYLNSLSYFDASFMKVRTITLGYNFDQSNWLKGKGISRLRLYATVQNPFVAFSPYYKESGMDPETNSYANNPQASAVTYGNNQRRLLQTGLNTPSTRNYIFGLNLTF